MTRTTAEQHLQDGQLSDALAELQQQVRNDPADPKLRVFLFQLLTVMGDWERALNQLNVVAEMDAGTLAMAQTYREALRCEKLRLEVFAGKRQPLLFGEPSEWLAQLLEALRATAAGRHTQAEELRGRALEAAPAIAGRIDDQPFQWLADADPRLGPVLEAVINGRYYWVPIERVRSLALEEPSDLRDLVWLPAHFTWTNGGETVALIPSRYPGSETSDDDALRLCRRTEWRTIDASDDAAPQLGLGQRLLATDSDDYPLLAVRAIELDQPEPVETGQGENGLG